MRTSNLRGLLQEAIDRRAGVTFRQLQELVESEERREPRGLLLNRTTASQLVRGTYRGVPTPGTIRAIAWLAGVPEAEAFAAAGQASPGPPFAEELPQDVDALSTKERRAVIEVLRALLSSRQELMSHESETAATLVRLLVEAEDVRRSAEFLEEDDDSADDEGFLAREPGELTSQVSALLLSVYNAALDALEGDGAKLQRMRAVVAMERRSQREQLIRVQRDRARQDALAQIRAERADTSSPNRLEPVESPDINRATKNTGPKRDLSSFVAEQVDSAEPASSASATDSRHLVNEDAADAQ